MSIIHTEYSPENNNTFVSSSGLFPIYIQSWAPEKEEDIKGVFQLTHGMAEYSDRYEDFGNYLAEKGYAVFIHDHMGHGKSTKSDDDLGYFGEDKDNWKHLIEDVYSVTKIAKEKYPGKPFYLFGHSMGSFVARGYLEKYSNELNGAVICGTSGANPAAGLAVYIAAAVGKIKGSRYKSNFINNLAFGSYNKKFAKDGDCGFSWLSVNEDNVSFYNKNKYCGYTFTTSGFMGLFGLLSHVSKIECFEKVKKDLPLLLISGKDDPVGSYGKGVKEVYDNFIKTGHKLTSIKLFDGLRHEILNEKCNRDIYDYIIDWLDKVEKN